MIVTHVTKSSATSKMFRRELKRVQRGEEASLKQFSEQMATFQKVDAKSRQRQKQKYFKKKSARRQNATANRAGDQ